MRLMAGMLIVILALVAGCSKAPSDEVATEDPAQEEPIYGEDFETGDSADQLAEPAEDSTEEEPAEAPSAE